MNSRTLKIFILMMSVMMFILFVGCDKDKKGSVLDVEPNGYVPSPLTNTTWQSIDDPETVGWSTEQLQRAYAFAQTIQTAAVMIIHQDKVLYHWGDIYRKFFLHSCRKSLLSALYGPAVQAGQIDLDATMADLGIDDYPPSLTELEKTATVRMLLKARSGVYHEAAAESQGMRNARPERHSHAPGTFWYYNNWDFNVLGTIYREQTEFDINAAFKEKIADPIGMEDFTLDDSWYQYEHYSMHPAYPFQMTAKDMARFGLLMLNRGEWNGQQIIPEDWVEESTTSYSAAGSAGGYGYMWWVAVGGQHVPTVTLPDGSYSARGYGGHYVLVIPEYDLVIVHRVNTWNGHSVNSVEFGLLVGLILEARPGAESN